VDAGKPAAEAAPAAKDPPPPPFFDQWLASLKFIAGWNDQRKYDAGEVKKAFSDHLAAEAVLNRKTVEQLCRTIVPLLLDLESVDSMVVANLRKEVLRTLKIVQVCILRVVTFELCREQSAKLSQKKTKKGDAKAGPQIPLDKQTYLASDISSLAKVVGHFKFEPTFTKGLHQLIIAIKRAKKDKILVQPDAGKKEKETTPAAKKRGAGAAAAASAEDAGAAGKRKAGDTGDEPEEQKGKKAAKTEPAKDTAKEGAKTAKPVEKEQAAKQETEETAKEEEGQPAKEDETAKEENNTAEGDKAVKVEEKGESTTKGTLENGNESCESGATKEPSELEKKDSETNEPPKKKPRIVS